MSTSKDVAQLAGVSPATVSRVFRGEAIVSEKTRKLVMDCARWLGYTPSLAASVLKKQNNHTVAFLDPDPQNPFYIQTISRISDVLREQYGYHTMMAPDTKYGHLVRESIQFFLSYRVECIVFSPIKNRSDPQLAELFQTEQDCRFLQLHSKLYPQVSSLYYNDVAGMEEATSCLLENGHRRILIVSDDRNRIRGCFDAYRAAGIAKPEIPVTPLPVGVSAEQVMELIQRWQPTAVIAVAEMFGLPAYSAITKLGLRVPEDISLIVYDDTAWTKALGITVVTHSEEDVVNGAVDSILGMIRGDIESPRHTKLPAYLLHRDSVRRL